MTHTPRTLQSPAEIQAAHIAEFGRPATITTKDTPMNAEHTIRFTDTTTTPGKLAEAEIHFHAGMFAGLRLIGFAIWERRTGNGRNVTFPARTYSVNGERRSFALLRPTDDARAQDRIRDLILAAYETHTAGQTEPDGFIWAPDTTPAEATPRP